MTLNMTSNIFINSFIIVVRFPDFHPVSFLGNEYCSKVLEAVDYNNAMIPNRSNFQACDLVFGDSPRGCKQLIGCYELPGQAYT